jgi:hypothetical protein
VLEVSVELNGQSLPNATVLVTGENVDMTLPTDADGNVVREYTFETITSAGREGMGKNGQLSVTHFGLEASETIELDSNNQVTLALEDATPPTVSDVSYTPSMFTLKKSIFVRAKVEDTGIRSLESVHISYRVDGGGWHNVTMVETEPGVYEGTIPKQNMVDLEFKVVAVDVLGNAEESSTESVDVGSDEEILMLLLLAIIVFVILIVIVITLKNRSTISKYLRDKYNPDRYPNLSKPEDEKK